MEIGFTIRYKSSRKYLSTVSRYDKQYCVHLVGYEEASGETTYGKRYSSELFLCLCAEIALSTKQTIFNLSWEALQTCGTATVRKPPGLQTKVTRCSWNIHSPSGNSWLYLIKLVKIKQDTFVSFLFSLVWLLITTRQEALFIYLQFSYQLVHTHTHTRAFPSKEEYRHHISQGSSRKCSFHTLPPCTKFPHSFRGNGRLISKLSCLNHSFCTFILRFSHHFLCRLVRSGVNEPKLFTNLSNIVFSHTLLSK